MRGRSRRMGENSPRCGSEWNPMSSQTRYPKRSRSSDTVRSVMGSITPALNTNAITGPPIREEVLRIQTENQKPRWSIGKLQEGTTCLRIIVAVEQQSRRLRGREHAVSTGQHSQRLFWARGDHDEGRVPGGVGQRRVQQRQESVQRCGQQRCVGDSAGVSSQTPRTRAPDLL
eukprot:1925076-Rhodomonas_salina.3